MGSVRCILCAHAIREKALGRSLPYVSGSHHFQRMLVLSPLTLWRV